MSNTHAEDAIRGIMRTFVTVLSSIVVLVIFLMWSGSLLTNATCTEDQNGTHCVTAISAFMAAILAMLSFWLMMGSAFIMPHMRVPGLVILALWCIVLVGDTFNVFVAQRDYYVRLCAELMAPFIAFLTWMFLHKMWRVLGCGASRKKKSDGVEVEAGVETAAAPTVESSEPDAEA